MVKFELAMPFVIAHAAPLDTRVARWGRASGIHREEKAYQGGPRSYRRFHEELRFVQQGKNSRIKWPGKMEMYCGVFVTHSNSRLGLASFTPHDLGVFIAEIPEPAATQTTKQPHA